MIVTDMTVAQLRAEARERNIPGRSAMRKPELIEAVTEARAVEARERQKAARPEVLATVTELRSRRNGGGRLPRKVKKAITRLQLTGQPAERLTGPARRRHEKATRRALRGLPVAA